MARCWQTFITIFEKNIKIVFLLFKCKEKKTQHRVMIIKNIQAICIYILNNIVQMIKRSKSFYLNLATFNLNLNKPINIFK